MVYFTALAIRKEKTIIDTTAKDEITITTLFFLFKPKIKATKLKINRIINRTE